MITSTNSFYYNLKKSIETKNIDLLKDIIYNELAKIFVYNKKEIENIFIKNNINYNKNECFLNLLLKNKNKISKEVSDLIINKIKLEEQEINDLKKILTNFIIFLDESDISIIKNKIFNYKELVNKSYYEDNDKINKKNTIKNPLKKIKYILFFIGISYLFYYLYLKKKYIKNSINNNNELNNNNNKLNNYIEKI